NVQLKSVEAPALRLELPPVHVPHGVPDTEMLLMSESPVFFSVTVIVTAVPVSTVSLGVTLFKVKVVEGWITVTVPLVVSPVGETSLPTASLPCPVAVQLVVFVAVNAQLNVVEAPGASVVAAPVHGVHPVPVTETFVKGESPVLVSITVIVTAVP